MKKEKKKENSLKKIFYRFSTWVTKATGKPMAFLLALLSVIIWATSGRFFNYSENWQLVINTGTTIITFLMIFVIQQSQNRDTAALHLKLNELIATNKETSNRLVASEDLSEEELEVIKKYYKKISEHPNNESVFTSHSIDEADKDSEEKLKARTGNKNSKSKT
ncbi:MAG: low affinity iron permease family protein [Ferruginibacter sp.]